MVDGRISAGFRLRIENTNSCVTLQGLPETDRQMWSSPESHAEVAVGQSSGQGGYKLEFTGLFHSVSGWTQLAPPGSSIQLTGLSATSELLISAGHTRSVTDSFGLRLGTRNWKSGTITQRCVQLAFFEIGCVRPLHPSMQRRSILQT